jgi:hypothetical protein
VRHVVGVHDPLAAEALPDLLVVRHVVAMAQEQVPHSAQLLQSLQERARGARGVDEDVAVRASDQVARRAERRLRGEPAIVHLALDPLGEGA